MQSRLPRFPGLVDKKYKHDEIKRNDCSRLPLCNQFHQVNTGTIPGFTTVLPTLNKHDENIDIGSTEQGKYAGG